MVDPCLAVDELVPPIVDCGRRIANKIWKQSPPWRHESDRESDRNIALCSLYEFMENRCDDAALQIMIDRALDASDPLWSRLSAMEKEMALDLLIDCHTKIEQECRRIKDTLGSS